MLRVVWVDWIIGVGLREVVSRPTLVDDEAVGDDSFSFGALVCGLRISMGIHVQEQKELADPCQAGTPDSSSASKLDLSSFVGLMVKGSCTKSNISTHSHNIYLLLHRSS